MQFRSFKLSDAKDHILTALLLLLALSLMISRHRGGMNSLRQASIAALSYIEEPLANVRVYRQALNTNTYLQRQNVLLQDELSRLRSLDQENRELRRMLEFKESSPYKLQPVLVVGKHLTGLNNFITVDAGADDSVKTGMPVVTSDGLVGRVVVTGDSYSQVMPLYNSLFRMSASIQENGASGIVSWPGDKIGELVLDFVPNTVRVDSGYVIQTSGAGNQSPAGIPIGMVLRSEPREGKETQRIFLRPFVSLSEMDKAFVVRFEPDTSVTKLEDQFNRLFE